MDATEAVAVFDRLKDSAEVSDPQLLNDVFAALPPASVEFMIGPWRGGELASGHPLDGQLAKTGWHGKTFTAAADVQPLICRDADGNLFSNTELGHGEASLWMVEHGGVSTASMVYDGQPVIDHFKKVDDNTVMGVMNGKAALKSGRLYYFYLIRE